LKRLKKRGKDMAKLDPILRALCAGQALPPPLRDHPLTGTWKGWRDCHIEPDWLLIYRATESLLILGRSGTHADLFE